MIIWTTNEADYPDHSFLYVSKLGDNANAGTKDAPLLEINAAIAIAEADAGYVTQLIAIVIGEGVWGEILSNTRTKSYKFIGDGFVEIDCASGARMNWRQNEHGVNLRITGMPDLTDFFGMPNYLVLTLTNCFVNSIYHTNTYSGGYSNNIFRMENCVVEKIHFKSNPALSLHMTPQWNNCVVKSVNLQNDGNQSYSGQIIKLYNNVFHEIIEFSLGNVIFGIINDYNLFADNESSELNALCPSGFKFMTSGTANAHSVFNQDPEFNNEALGDYSLKETSPCLLAGLNRASIGAYNRGWPHYSFTEIFRSIIGAVYSQSYFGGTLEQDIVADADAGSFELESGHNAGTVVSAIGNLGAPQRIDRIESLIDFGTDVDGYHTNLPVWSDFLFAAYDSARKYFEGDTISEGGVKYICILDYPNESPFVEYPPASSPTYWAVSAIPTATNVVPNFLFRFGNSLTEVNAAAWKLMPFKGAFLVDENGKGSADPDYNAATGRYLTFSRYQFKIKLKNL